MKICIASVVAGLELKKAIKKHLKARNNINLTDLGVYSGKKYVSYVEIASNVARRIQNGEYEKGILICGTGMGMALVANKFKGVIASVCESVYSAGMARIVNNANVLALGQFILGKELACQMVDAWFYKKPFEGFPPEWAKALKQGIEDIKNIEENNFGNVAKFLCQKKLNLV